MRPIAEGPTLLFPSSPILTDFALGLLNHYRQSSDDLLIIRILCFGEFVHGFCGSLPAQSLRILPILALPPKYFGTTRT